MTDDHPQNCPIVERTADGIAVGRCWFWMEDGHTCPRHGDLNLPEEKRRCDLCGAAYIDGKCRCIWGFSSNWGKPASKKSSIFAKHPVLTAVIGVISVALGYLLSRYFFS